MTARPARGGMGAGTDPTPWLILGVVGVGLAAAGVVWLGGTLAALCTGGGWHPPAFGTAFVEQVAHGRLAELWPGTSPAAVWAVTGALLALLVGTLITGYVLWQRRRPVPGDPLPSLATPADVAGLGPRGVEARARGLRPSLTGQKIVAAADAGVPLGDLVGSRRGHDLPLRASWEDVLLAVMAPRAGKTTALAVPAIAQAPGPVVATSNKADLWTVTSGARRSRGTVWVFDPQRIAHHPQQWWWDPLAEVRDVEAAHRLAQHFVLAKTDRGSGSGSDFWDKAAQELLTALLLAAGCSGGTVADVYEWLTDSSARAPAAALEGAGHLAVALSLRGMQTGATETREGIYQTARTSAQALRDPVILRWVTPPADPLPQLHPAVFVTTDTLYLLSKDGAGSAAPLIAALTDATFRAGVAAAETAGGRLDPPLVAVLDEAANICRIADLPDLYSHLGSRGIIPVTILQSYRQGVRVWGEPGMDALWSAATVKVIGAGIDDARTAEDLSRLVGEHDVATVSSSRSRDGWSTSTSQRRQRILGPEDIRALPRGRALLLATGARAAMLRLRPWYDGPDAQQLEAARQEAEALLRERAVQAKTVATG